MSSKRIYRQDCSGARLTSFNVTVKETDLWIAVSSSAYSENLPARVEQLILNRRQALESHLALYPHLASSLKPCLAGENAPEIFRRMVKAGNRAGVGPMAAVAGALAEEAGRFLETLSPEVIVENGGDIFIHVTEPVRVGIYAGSSPLSDRLALEIAPALTPLGVCTSSGTVGPSISMGRADAAVALSRSTPLADAAATALGNLVQAPADLEKALEFACATEGITGALLICGEKIAAWGEIKLKRIKGV